MAKLAVELEVIDKGKAVITGFSSNLEQQMKKSERNVDSFGTSFATTAGRLSAGLLGIAGAAGAGAAGITALVTSSAQHVREMTTLATLAGESVQEFSALAFATESVGINAEKLADISKDVKDKLGDFVATGGGAFKDFFEQVAPQVGLTAKELQNLSGPDVLVAVKKAMDDANISYEEQIFYLEAIGNDAAKLIPLLANNGEEMRRNAERAKELGVALDNVDNQKLLDAEQSSRELGAAFDGLKTRLAVEFAPVFESVVGSLADGIAGLSKSLDGLSEKRTAIKLREELGSINAEIYHGEHGIFGAGVFGMRTDDELAQLKEKRAALKKKISEVESGSSREQANAALATKSAPSAYVPNQLPGGSGGGQSAPSILTGDYDKLDASLKKYFGDLDAVAGKEAQRTATLRESMEATNRHILALNGISSATGVAEDSWSRLVTLNKEYEESLKDTAGTADETFLDMEGAMTGWAAGWSGTLTDVLFGAKTTFAEVGISFAKMATQMMVQKALVSGIEFAFAAQGDVFSGPGISAYSNSVVSKPTVFPFAKGVGLMGEAGSEAVMPLARMSGGDLGVKVQGGGGNFQVVNHISIDRGAGGSERDKRAYADMIAMAIRREVKDTIVEEMRYGGALYHR